MIRDFPISPSSNSLYRNAPGKGRVKTKQYREYCDEVAFWTLLHVRELKKARILLKEIISIHKTVQVDLTFCIAEERCFTKNGEVKKLDTFNLIKALHDQLSEYLWTDDRYFWDGDIRRQICSKGSERVIIRIKGRQ